MDIKYVYKYIHALIALLTLQRSYNFILKTLTIFYDSLFILPRQQRQPHHKYTIIISKERLWSIYTRISFFR